MVFSELIVIIIKDVQIKVNFFISSLGPALVSILLTHSALTEKT